MLIGLYKYLLFVEIISPVYQIHPVTYEKIYQNSCVEQYLQTKTQLLNPVLHLGVQYIMDPTHIAGCDAILSTAAIFS